MMDRLIIESRRRKNNTHQDASAGQLADRFSYSTFKLFVKMNMCVNRFLTESRDSDIAKQYNLEPAKRQKAAMRCSWELHGKVTVGLASQCVTHLNGLYINLYSPKIR